MSNKSQLIRLYANHTKNDFLYRAVLSYMVGYDSMPN